MNASGPCIPFASEWTLAKVDLAIQTNAASDAVEALRALEGADDAVRTAARDRIDTYLKDNPQKRPRAVVDLLIALRGV